MLFRKADRRDLPAIAAIYSDIHTEVEAGRTTIGRLRDIYPTEQTAETALERGDLFVGEDGGTVVGTAITNRLQTDVYESADWTHKVPDHHIMVLHTLAISPGAFRKGYGKRVVAFYGQYALEHGCPYLRMDTNERNLKARAMYQKLGYQEIGFVPCDFNGIDGVRLVLPEKKPG